MRQPLPNLPNRYLKKSLPPIEFEYGLVPTAGELARKPVREADPESIENLPVGLDGTNYQWMDLDGEGASGILTEQGEGWFYKRNLSANRQVREDGHEYTAVHFGPVELVRTKPALALAGGAQFLDLAGDGQVDCVQMEGPVPGFYERSNDASWEPFRPFASWPNVSARDPDLRFADLTGDGHADILITEGEALTWYPSLAEDGFGPAVRVHLPVDEERGPRLVFSDALQSVYLADFSGDGLSDLVRIRNGEVCYWPNLGYSRFGAKVTMDNAPRFDAPDQFDQRRVRLADTDGSGTTDILYLRHDGVHVYFNQSGNRWSEAAVLPQFPPVDNVASVQVVDLLGNGTACLVWSSPLPHAARQSMRYLALMDEKPHLLVSTKNNLGAETRVRYAPSTKFYLDDRQDGNPWITRLPFPVHVVERVETYDRVSRNRFVSRYKYHDGYFDGVEREFRGFGMVEQFDTEEIGDISPADGSSVATNLDAASFVPPIHTKTWFHTGAFLRGQEISRHLAGRYYGAPEERNGLAFAAFLTTLLDDTVLPAGLTIEEQREACRALKGSMLRQEVYGLDGTNKAKHPYTVTEQNFTIERLQSKAANRFGVFLTHAREALSYHYERNPDDPRIGHAMTLEVDLYGNALKTLAIGYGRKISPLDEESDRKKQTQTLITYTETTVTNPIDDAAHPDDYRVPMAAEVRTDELTGYILADDAARFRLADFVKPAPPDNTDPKRLRRLLIFDRELLYEAKPTVGRERRPIERVRTLYRKNDLSALSPFPEVESLALPGESYKLAFTPGLLAQAFRREGEALLPTPATVLEGRGPGQGGYVGFDGNWWIPSGRRFFSAPDPLIAKELTEEELVEEELNEARQHFFMPRKYTDPFGQSSTIEFDDDDLLVFKTSDALSNTVTAVNDYRVLGPQMITDPNGNRSAVRFDALGMVVATAVMGKVPPSRVEGDSFNTFTSDLSAPQVRAYLADPHPLAGGHLGTATTRIIYDLDRIPACAATIVRETHVSDLSLGQSTKVQLSFSYSDGFGREIQKKIQAEPGPVPRRDENDKIIVDANVQPEMTPGDVSHRWVGSGWTVFNNKGKPVRQYEPFFTDRHQFEFDERIGVSPVLFYDPVERVVATLHPNHTWEKVVFDPWKQETWDVNDTALGDDPTADAAVGNFFKRLVREEFLPTWRSLRTDPAHAVAFAARYTDATDRENETRAAEKTDIHAATPTVAHADSLGRAFLTVAHNKFKYSNAPGDLPPEEHRTRLILDIEGNQREVIDANDRVVMRYDYDILGNRVHQASMEAGERWTLNDVAGKPLYAWDSRDHRFRTAYDPLRRPTHSFLREGASDEMVVGRSIYGESRPNPEANNLRGKVAQLFDQAGVVTTDKYDFKGNLLGSRRQLVEFVNPLAARIPAYMTTVDWTIEPELDKATYTSRTRYDALNRPIQLIAPHSDQPGTTVNIIQPIFNEANLLEQVHAWLNQIAEPDRLLDIETANLPAVLGIDYDAKGQRILIDHGAQDGKIIRTSYSYERETFRLTHIYTRRGVDPLTGEGVSFTGDCDNPRPPPSTIAAPKVPPQGKPCGLQNLHYTYDPAGNITHIRDDAQQAIYFKNKRVEPSADYTYDAIYRLIEGGGREHLGQVGGAPIPHSHNDAGRVGICSPGPGGEFHPHDGTAMDRYCECYVYDKVGNITEMIHRVSCPGAESWSRIYNYNEASQFERGKQSNRLTSTTIGGTTETYSAAGDGYDAHGSMLRMPHLQVMQWDFQDQLQMTQRQKVTNDDADGVPRHGERTWYVYDATGQRVRKVTELATGQVKDERIYLGGFERYRKNGANPLVRETLHIMDDKQRIALVETHTQGDEPDVPRQLVRYQFGNHLGSVSLELDNGAQIISYEEYTPYGSTSYQAVRSKTETSKRYRYTGMERDEESGLSYHGLRYYPPWLGRWVSVDPIGIQAATNLYAYCRGNPAALSDPEGTDPPMSVDPSLWVSQQPFPPTSVDSSPSVSQQASPPMSVDPGSPTEEISRLDTISGVYGFFGYNQGESVTTEALILGGYDRHDGLFGASLIGVGVEHERHGSRLRSVGVVQATETLFFFREGTFQVKEEHLLLAEAEFWSLGRLDVGGGVFVNETEPEESGTYVYGSVGPVVFGGGVTGHVNYVEEMRQTLASNGIQLVQVPPPVEISTKWDVVLRQLIGEERLRRFNEDSVRHHASRGLTIVDLTGRE